jgi:hypothetical protein
MSLVIAPIRLYTYRAKVTANWGFAFGGIVAKGKQVSFADKIRYCIVCGQSFVAKTARQKYCSRKCSSKVYREKKGIKLKDGRYCKQCGKKFYPNYKDGKNRQHCSDECSRKSARNSMSKYWSTNKSEKQKKQQKVYSKKNGKDSKMKRFLKRYPNAPKECQACGENRVLEICHKPEYRRQGAWRTVANTQLHMVWILCPTCHSLLDRKGYALEEIGLKDESTDVK